MGSWESFKGSREEKELQVEGESHPLEDSEFFLILPLENQETFSVFWPLFFIHSQTELMQMFSIPFFSF